MRMLYHTPLSPFCRKIRALLKEKNLTFELQEENVWERRPEFLRLNPAAEVPVLIEEDGRVVAGSYAIAEYLEEAYPERNLMGKSLGERGEVRRLISWFDNKLNFEVTRNLLNEKVFKRLMGSGEPSSEAIRAGKTNIKYHLDYIGYLAEKRSWLAGERITVADLTAASHLSALDYLSDVPWEHNETAKEWYAVMKSRPSFRGILADRLSGMKPPEHYDNPDF